LLKGIRRGWVVVATWVGLVVLAGEWTWPSHAQLAPTPSAKADASRFDFMIVESFDAQYLGDTPGHLGRGGALGQTAPRVALGDPVFRDETRIGRVSHVVWDRTKESLEIEFDPDPTVDRISVGDSVWISIK
jgi:hypothetical protein